MLLAHVVSVDQHKFDVALIPATLAHVVNMRKHKFDVTLIEYVALFENTRQLEKTKANRFCPKRQIPCKEER